jgi:hypothetical protein
MNRDILDSEVTGYGWTTGIRLSTGLGIFFFFTMFRTTRRPSLIPVPGDKVIVNWIWPTHFGFVRSCSMHGVVLRHWRNTALLLWINLSTLWRRSLLKTRVVAQSRNPLPFNESKDSLPHSRPSLIPTQNQMNAVHTLPTSFFENRALLYPSLRFDFRVVSSLQAFRPKCLCIFRVLRPPWFDHLNNC